MGNLFYQFCINVLARSIFGLLGPIRVLHGERAARPGAWLLAANHISHFDPPLLEVTARRELDFIAMKELFETPLSAAFFRATNAFPTDRSKVDRAAVREALKRLGRGRVVGIFPEGGIRTGRESLLEGGAMRPGVAALAQMAGVPIIPAIVLGSDTLYTKRNWLPFRRTRFWVAYGEPLHVNSEENPALSGRESREQLERDLAAAFKALYHELLTTFQLGPEVAPRSFEEHRGLPPESQTQSES